VLGAAKCQYVLAKVTVMRWPTETDAEVPLSASPTDSGPSALIDTDVEVEVSPLLAVTVAAGDEPQAVATTASRTTIVGTRCRWSVVAIPTPFSPVWTTDRSKWFPT